jgi:cyclase
MIETLAVQCRMPLCYGGGIKTVEQARRVFGLGVEKVAISSGAIENPKLVAGIAEQIGKQSVIVVLDVRKAATGGAYEVWTHNATRNSGKDPVSLARDFEGLGAVGIVVNSIDNDGVMQGYDWELAERMRSGIDCPLTVLGGAGSLNDIRRLIERYKIIGAAAGSLFVFKGVYRAVLINYPKLQEKKALHTPTGETA